MEKVAVKSGYYFELFNKDEIPNTLKKADYKVQVDGMVYDLYKGQSIEDERTIDKMFGDRIGYPLSEHKVKENEVEDEFE